MPCLGILMGFRVLVDLERVEVVELIEPQQAVLPELRVVDLAFFEQQFAADHAVARNRVAFKLDARDVELLAFVDIDDQRNRLLLVVVGQLGNRAKVDVAELPVGLLQVFEALADCGGIEPVAVLDGERGAQALGVLHGLVAGEGDRSQPVALAFFNRHQDVDALASAGTEGEPVQAAFVANLRLRLFHRGVGVALVAIGLAHALGVLFELRGVVRLRKQVLKDDRVGNADRLQVLHRAPQIQRAQVLVARESECCRPSPSGLP